MTDHAGPRRSVASVPQALSYIKENEITSYGLYSIEKVVTVENEISRKIRDINYFISN